MKRLVLLSLAALAAVFLLSSCVYDSLYTGYSGSSYYAGDYGYSGGFSNGIYSDFYLGFHNDYYRYRHTRCSHCNRYPCRGGHVARYYTYHRNYRSPLHGRARQNHNAGRGSHGTRGGNRFQRIQASPRYRDSGRGSGTRRSYRQTHTGNNIGHFGRFREPTGNSGQRTQRNRSNAAPRSNPRTFRNASPPRSTPRLSPPPTRGGGNRSRGARPDPRSVAVARPNPRPAPGSGRAEGRGRSGRSQTTVVKHSPPPTTTKTARNAMRTRSSGRNLGRSSSGGRSGSRGNSARHVKRR